MNRVPKLAEVSLPLEAINEAARAEKAVPKKGHPATLHLWWSRKPLGAARAMLFASLIDDPIGHPEVWPTEESQAKRRHELHDLIVRLAEWDADNRVIAEARTELASQFGDDPPTILDPFCGGGTVPLEALRLGLPVRAIDLNPVAALVTKAMVEVAQRFESARAVRATGTLFDEIGTTSSLGDDVRRFGGRALEIAWERVGYLYPELQSRHRPSGLTVPVSLLWARMIMCASPACGRPTPLLSTWWLSKKKSNEWHARPEVSGGDFRFAVHEGPPPAELRDLKAGRGANFHCVHCGHLNEIAHVQAQGKTLGFPLRLVAVQAFRDPSSRRSGRVWLDPTPELDSTADVAVDAGAPALDARVPSVNGNATLYGIMTFRDLLSPRQRATMVAFRDAIAGLTEEITSAASERGLPADDQRRLDEGGGGAAAYAEAVRTYLGLTLSRMANRFSTMTVHNRANGSVEQSFVQPAYSFYGEFPEANPFSGSTGSWANALDHVAEAVANLPRSRARVEVTAGSALTVPFGDAVAVCTDPPYYDMFDYAALSNLFYVWMREAIGDIWPKETAFLEAPSAEQVVSNPARFGGSAKQGHAHFESQLRTALSRMADAQRPDIPLTIYYGYKQQASGKGGTAWEALLESIFGAGLGVVSTWPLRTERPEGVKKQSNSLASSILLVCRKMPVDAARCTKAEFRRELRRELPHAVQLLVDGGIAPVDLSQAAVGPGMAVFSRYSSVLAADGTPLRVREVLDLINEVLDEALMAEADDIDPGSRWALTWYEQHGTDTGPFGEAEQLSKARNTSVTDLEEAGIVRASSGVVRLMERHEIDGRPKGPLGGAWRGALLAARELERNGEAGLGRVLASMDPDSRNGARQLAHRLYQIAEARGDVSNAVAFNAMTVAWARGGDALAAQPSLID